MRKIAAATFMTGVLLLAACGNNDKDVEKEDLEQEEALEESEQDDGLEEESKDEQNLPKKELVEKEEIEDPRLSIVQDYIASLYFATGTYKEYVALHADPDEAISEEVFADFSEGSRPESSFDSGNLEEIIKGLKIDEIDENEAIVYWVEDESQTFDDARHGWKVVKVDDEWKLSE